MPYTPGPRHRQKRPHTDPAAAQWIEGLTPIGIEAGAKIKSSDNDIYIVGETGAIMNTTRPRGTKKQRRKDREWRKQIAISTADLALPLEQVGR